MRSGAGIRPLKQELSRCGNRNSFRLGIRGWVHAFLFGRGRCSSVLDPHVDGVIGGIAQVLHPVLEGRKPSGFAGLGVDLLHLSVLVGELEVTFGEDNDHSSRMLVHTRLLVWAVVHIHDLHPFILKPQ